MQPQPLNADLDLDAIISAIAHEFRTPLAVITGMTRTLATMSDGLPPSTVAEMHAALERSADQLTDMFTQIADARRILAGTCVLHLTPVEGCRFVLCLPLGSSPARSAEAPSGRLQPEGSPELCPEAIDFAQR